MKNIQAIAAMSDTCLEKAAKATIFLTDLSDFPVVNAAHGEFFPANPPARSTVGVTVLPLGASIEIEMIIAM